METAAYDRLLMFYTGVEHAIDLTQARLSRKVALARPIASRLHSVGLELLGNPCWPTSNRELGCAWETGVKSIPFLAEKRILFEEVSAQRELLLLLYCLAGLSIGLIEKDADFIAEKKKLLVAVRPLKMLVREAEIKATTPTEILGEISERLNAVNAFANAKAVPSRH